MIKVWVTKQAALTCTKSLRIKGWLNSGFNVWVPGMIGRATGFDTDGERVKVTFYPPRPSNSVALLIPVTAIMLDRTWVQKHIPGVPLCRWATIKELLSGKDADRWLENPETKSPATVGCGNRHGVA